MEARRSRGDKRACHACDNYHREVIDKGYNAVFPPEFIHSERGGQNGKGKQQTVGKAEIQNGVTAKYSVIRHFGFAEVYKHGNRARRVHEERNRVQHPLFQKYRKRGDVYADIAYKQRYARENGVVDVVAVAHNHTVFAVVLYKHYYRRGDKVVLPFFPVERFEYAVATYRKADKYRNRHRVPYGKRIEPQKAVRGNVVYIEEVFEDIKGHYGDERKGQKDKIFRLGFEAVADEQQRASRDIQRVLREKRSHIQPFGHKQIYFVVNFLHGRTVGFFCYVEVAAVKARNYDEYGHNVLEYVSAALFAEVDGKRQK